MINLCEILKGHEKETFYCTICGDCKVSINNDAESGTPITISTDTFTISLNKFGNLLNKGECLLFPSKDQRDWSKWIEEQSPWISVKDRLPELSVEVIIYHDGEYFVGYMYFSMLTNWWRVSQDERMDIIVSEDDLWMLIPHINN